MIRFTGRRGKAGVIAATTVAAVAALSAQVLSQAGTAPGTPIRAAKVAAGSPHLKTSASVHQVDLTASSDGISSGDACAAPATFQLAAGQFTAQVCAGGTDGSTTNPTPRVTVISAPLGPEDDGFLASCHLDIQLLDAGGNIVTDHTTGCASGLQSGDLYPYDGLGKGNAPGTGTFTAHATLTYQPTTVAGPVAIDLGTSPAYTAGLHRCIGPGTSGITSGGDPATFTFSAGQEVVVELDSTDPLGTVVSAALGNDVNSGAEGTTGISTIGRAFDAKFSQYGTVPMSWTISIGSSLGADIPADGGPVGNGLPGGAGNVAWFAYSDRC
jgi:hypothetical protein